MTLLRQEMPGDGRDVVAVRAGLHKSLSVTIGQAESTAIESVIHGARLLDASRGDSGAENELVFSSVVGNDGTDGVDCDVDFRIERSLHRQDCEQLRLLVNGN